MSTLIYTLAAQTPPVDASLEEVLDTIPGIVEAFSTGSVLAGMLAVFSALMLALNFGPLKRVIAESKVDWIAPLAMLLLTGGTTGISAILMTPGMGVVSAIITGVVAAAGSGLIQKVIQEFND